MRALLTLLIFFLYQVVLAQSQGIKLIPKEYESLNSSPWVFTQGDTLIIMVDSVYLVNSTRYNFYKKIHTNILNSDDSTCSDLLQSYEDRLDDFDHRYQQLAKNSNEGRAITLGLLQEAMEEIEEVKISLGSAQKDLEETRKGLDEAKKELRKAKGQTRKKVILGGAVGLGIGLILGILIGL